MQKKLLNWVIAIVVLVNLAIVAVVVLDQSSAPVVRLPDPNGYDDLVKAGRMVKDSPIDFTEMSTDQLRAHLAENSEALQLLRVGLGRTSRVPEYSMEELQKHFDDFVGLKSLNRLLLARGKLAEIEQRTNDAAAVYIEAIHMGGQISHGGLLIDRMVGIAFEFGGINALERLTGQLDAAALNRTVSVLKELESKRETAASVVERERAWSRRTGGIQGLFVRITTFVTGSPLDPAIQKFFAQEQNLQKKTAKVLTDLGTRAREQAPATPR